MKPTSFPAERGSGVICLNGAAARLVQPGDKVIIISYAMMTNEEAKRHKPIVAVLGDENQVVQLIREEVHATVLE